jgi:CRISPR-associated protein Cas1
MGPTFNRDQAGGGVNGLLNYGYTVLRALVSRAICAAGLHPTISVFHSNRANAFALADDLMEPYRPLVDLMVRRLVARGVTDVDSEAKHELARIGVLDLMSDSGVTPLGLHAQRFVHSVAQSFETGTPALTVPTKLVVVAVETGDDAA